jgi:hypothetical protein
MDLKPPDDDQTTLFNMSNAFQQLVSGDDMPLRKRDDMAHALDFDDTQTFPKAEPCPPLPRRKSAVSMQDILRKENEERLIRSQLEKAEKDLSVQKVKIENLESDLTSLRVKYEKDTKEHVYKEQVMVNCILGFIFLLFFRLCWRL